MTFKEAISKYHLPYVLVILVFLFFFLFADQSSLLKLIKLHKEVEGQEQEIEYYKQEIANSKQLLDGLQHDTATMERVARENYKMKRDNEVIYLIETQE